MAAALRSWLRYFPVDRIQAIIFSARQGRSQPLVSGRAVEPSLCTNSELSSYYIAILLWKYLLIFGVFFLNPLMHTSSHPVISRRKQNGHCGQSALKP